MNPLLTRTLTLCFGLGLGTSGAFAEEAPTTQSPPAARSPQQTKDAPAGKTMTGKLVKGSQIVGVKLFNQSAEHLGEINDFVFDENTGNVAYGILAIGGTLGIGEDLVAVPWKHIKQSEKDTPGFVVDVEKTKLNKDAPHFGKDKWPAFDDGWNQTNLTYYGMKTDQFKGVKLVRASTAIGSELWNQKAEKIGDIEDLLVHPNSGKVAYGVVDIGKWVDMGDKLTTVPWSLVRESKEASPGYVLNVEKSKLNESVFFERNTWPDYNDPAWNTRTYDYYATPYYWTTAGAY